MKSTKRESGREVDSNLTADVVLAVNPRITFRWSARSAEADNRSRNVIGAAEESVGLSTLRVEERTLLALADGRRSIDDLAKLAGMSGVAAVRHLRAMRDRGILVPSEAKDPAAGHQQLSRDQLSPDLLSRDQRSNEALAPRVPTDAVVTGPVEYDYSDALDGRTEPASPDATAPTVDGGSNLASSSPVSRGGSSLASVPTVIVGNNNTDISPSPPASLDGSETAPSTAPPENRAPPPKKKSSSGPNVTLFWIPTPNEHVPPGVTAAEPPSQPEPSHESGPTGAPRKTTGEGTVVVVGSPSGSSRASASVEQAIEAATGSGRSGPSPSGSGPSGSGPTGTGLRTLPGQGVASDLGSSPPAVSSSPPVTVVEGSVGAAAGPSVSAPIPFRVGSYEVATRIAQGAMGSIYVCRRVGAAGFQRLFTLKVVRQHSTQKQMAIKSFTREARIGSLVDHPNVQKLVDVGNYEGQPFLILDYIEGTNLAELLSDERRPPAPVLVSVMLDLLRGLQHVHDVVDEHGARSGLVHGDVSPQNVLIGVDGAARLTDFGSARFAMEREESEADQMAVGKPAYMAPEQLRGELGDARTDLFSVGIVMWTALTGQKLFAADTYDQTAMRVMRRKIPAPSEHGAPACLDAIVLKALNRAPEGRYSTADEMARDLLKAAAAENLVASARDVGQWVRRELGETLTEHRRKIQEMFGGQGMTPGPQVRAQPPRPHKTTPKTADGYERLPAKTIQISAISGKRPARRSASASASASAPAPVSNFTHRPSRSQWYVVILSAVVAGCALIVAIVYLVTSLATPPKRQAKRAPSGTAQVTAGGGAAVRVPAPAEPATKAVEPPAPRSDTPPGR